MAATKQTLPSGTFEAIVGLYDGDSFTFLGSNKIDRNLISPDFIPPAGSFEVVFANADSRYLMEQTPAGRLFDPL